MSPSGADRMARITHQHTERSNRLRATDLQLHHPPGPWASMTSDPDDVRDRARIEHRRPPVDDLDEAMWIAEDPVTECAGVGRVEAEAIGNLVAVVIEYERRDGSDPPLLKLPGSVVVRPSIRVASSTSMLDRLRSLF